MSAQVLPTTPSAIILSAHHCAPGMGSEHAVGWNYLRELARTHEIELITEDNGFRNSISKAVTGLNAEGAKVTVHFVRHGATTDGRKNNLRVFYYLTYTLYQWRVYKLAKTICCQRKISAAHHLTIVGFREPGFLWLLSKPFVWGPVGGLVFAPLKLLPVLSPKMQLFQLIRNVVTAAQFYLSPRVRLAYNATQRPGGCFIAATRDIGKRFTDFFGGEYVHAPETGANNIQDVRVTSVSSANAPLRLLWVGALIDIKPLNLLIEAISALGSQSEMIELDVIGDGDSRERFQALAVERSVKATFHGWIEYHAVHQLYRERDLCVLLSMKDLTTNVVFESLTSGLPVLCMDHHGYSEIVDATCGYKVALGTPYNVTADLSAILSGICQDRSALKVKSNGARARAQEFTWERNASVLRSIYDAAGADRINEQLPA